MASKNEPWKECIDWLIRCQVLRPAIPGASLEVLAHTLRDGVLLCTLLDILDPDCINMRNVHQNPQMTRFLCLYNIKIFLQTCQDVFGLKDTDLFEPSMLFDFCDIYQVINTLSKLSNCSKAQRRNVPGFTFHKNRDLTQTDVYKRLTTNDDDRQSLELSKDVAYSIYHSNAQNEVIYQKLCSIKLAQPPQSTTATTRPLEKRDYVIQELVESERRYVEVLTTIQESFMLPLGKRLSKEDIQGIFGEIKELSDMHQAFLSQLYKAVAPGSKTRLHSVFLLWCENFLIYGDYCANLENAQALLREKRMENSLVTEEILKCQQNVKEGKYSLQDLLVVPMQRILKYRLLLERLIGDTQPNHEDYQGLEEAKEAMMDVANYINEMKRDREKLEALHKIQDSIADLKMPENTELKDYGRCIKDDELRVRVHDEQKSSNRYVFLFDRVMLMCKQLKDNTYSFQESLNLAEYKVKDCLPTTGKDTRYQWYLVPKSKNKVYSLSARTAEQKRKWIKVIEETLDNIEPSGYSSTDHQFVMKTFEKPTTCSCCKKSLKGLIFQGYWCKICQISVHKECIVPSGGCAAQLARELPPPPVTARQVPPPPYADVMRWSDYRYLGQYMWFVGEIEREEASNLLRQRVNGTYLLRIRPQGRNRPNESVYALGLKTIQGVKHIIVFEKVTTNGLKQYYLSAARYFTSIAELVQFYEHTSLKENFEGLDEKFLLPFHQPVSPARFDQNPPQVPPQGVHEVSNEYDDYVDCDNAEDLMLKATAHIDPTEDSHSDVKSEPKEHNFSSDNDFTYEESIASPPNEQNSCSQSSEVINESSTEEVSTDRQQPSSEEDSWNKPPPSRAVLPPKQRSVSERYRKFVGTSQSLPGSSVNEQVKAKRLPISDNARKNKPTKLSLSEKTSRSQLDNPLTKDGAKPRTVTISDRSSGKKLAGSSLTTQLSGSRRPLSGSSMKEGVKPRQHLVGDKDGNRSLAASKPLPGSCGMREEVEVADRKHSVSDRDSKLLKSRKLPSAQTGNSNFPSAPLLPQSPSRDQLSTSVAMGTQTSSLDIPSTYDHIEIFGQFIVSELKTIRNKAILLQLKKIIQNDIIRAVENDNAN